MNENEKTKNVMVKDNIFIINKIHTFFSLSDDHVRVEMAPSLINFKSAAVILSASDKCFTSKLSAERSISIGLQ